MVQRKLSFHWNLCFANEWKSCWSIFLLFEYEICSWSRLGIRWCVRLQLHWHICFWFFTSYSYMTFAESIILDRFLFFHYYKYRISSYVVVNIEIDEQSLDVKWPSFWCHRISICLNIYYEIGALKFYISQQHQPKNLY